MKSKFFALLLLSFFLQADEIEVRLKTEGNLKPIYLSRFKTDPNEFDWRYFDELRNVLEYDFKTGGFAAILPIQQEWEQTFHWPDAKRDFDLALWRREKVPYVLTATIVKKNLQITAFNVDKGTSKRYPEFLLTGRLDEDRLSLHAISDAIHKDLFGTEGIASLRLIYTDRKKNDRSDYQCEIWISDYDGARPQQVTTGSSYCLTPCFYPKTAGAKNPSFYYVSYTQGQSKIYRATLGSAKPEPVVDLRGSQALATLNSKGTQMAFICDAAGRPDLFLQSFDDQGRQLGKARQLFTAPRATQASSTFSPDGKKIAFVSDKDGPPRIYMLDISSPKDTKRPKPRLLTTKNRENTTPSWSPDGKKLAYSAKSDGVRQIWIYNFETEEEFALTSGAENKENPSWAPDSLHLVYNTDNDEEGDLFLIDLHQQEPVQITRGSGQKRFPSFETR